MIDLNKKGNIEKLAKVKSSFMRNMLIKKDPEVILYAAKYWYDGSKEFKKLVCKAIALKPEIIVNFKNKYGLNVNTSTVHLAMLADPMVAKKMPAEMKAMIDMDMFIVGFAKNPLLLTVKDLPVLKEKIILNRPVVKDNGEQYIQKVVSNLRNECLKAIRLFEGVSKYHKQFDDFALAIANEIKNAKVVKNQRYSDELLKNFATLMNVLIKKENQKLRACSAEQWLVNNGKPMYKAVRTSAKKGSELEGLLADMPTNMIDPKVVKKLIITAIKINPEEYLKLEEYGLGQYKEDVTVKYNVFKSLKKHRMLKDAQNYISEEDIQKASGKVQGVEKRKEHKTTKRKTRYEQLKLFEME